MNEVVINTYLAGVRRFLASARAEATALAELGLATKGVGYEFAKTTKRSWLLNQSLFTARRLVYATTLAFIASGAMALKMGNDYNNAMQTARVALRPFFRDSEALNHTLNRLWTIAKYTPFQIKDMTLAFRGLYPALQGTGITADQLVDTIKNLIDALSVAGQVTPQALGRVTYALQHMLFQGRLTGRTVQQLAAVGIPIFRILNEEMGLTTDQLHNIAQMGIPASAVLQAINQWITKNPAYTNAAMRQSQRTVIGLLSTFRDNLSQTMGMAEKGWFKGFQRMTKGMNDWFQTLQDNMQKTHNLWVALDKTITPKSHYFLKIWHQIQGVFNNGLIVFRALVRTLLTSKPIWVAIFVVLGGLNLVLSGLAHTTAIWVPILKILIGYLVLKTAVVKGLAAYETIYWFIQKQIILSEFRWARAMRALAVAQGVWTVATKGYIRSANGQFIAMTRLQKAAYSLRMAYLSLAASMGITGGLLGILILATVAVVAGLVIMYFKWKAFHDLVNRTAQWLYNHAYILALIPIVGPFIAAMVLIIRYWKTLVHWIKQAVHYLGLLKKPFNWAGRAFGMSKSFLGLQHGGLVTQGGAFIVGERGPEVAMLPAGAAVSPVAPIAASERWRGKDDRPIQVRLVVDGRTLAEVVARHQTTVNARA